MQWCLSLLKPDRQNIYRFYQLELADDGTTFKNIDGRLVFHPILAPYLICDLLDVYRQSQDPRGLDAARKIADSAIARGQQFKHDSLVFWYDPLDGLSSVPGLFYSGLTQAWYVRAMCRLARIDRRFAPVVGQVFRSLFVTVEHGGVLLERPFGWVVEEYPHKPPFYTLNGWLTVLRWGAEERETLLEHNCPVDDFLRRNLDAVEHLLPYYDLPALYNTRYQLTGFSRVQLISDRTLNLEVNRLEVRVPGEVSIESDLSCGKRGRWNTFIERQEPRLLQFNVVLSMMGSPKPNELILDVLSSRSGTATWRIADGDYDPLSTGLPTRRWKTLTGLSIERGFNRLLLDLPMGPDNLIAYPTNFKKRIHGPSGLNYNGYHFVHVLDLAMDLTFFPS